MTPTVAAVATASLPLHNVFVYGSLLADEVVDALLKRVPPCSPAILNGYHRYSIKGRVYPAILPVESKTAMGRVIMGVTDAELHILDTFEDVEYERNTVEVFLNDDSGKLSAETYVWAHKDDPNLHGEWDFEDFTYRKLKSYEFTENAPLHNGSQREQEWKRLHLKDFLSMTEGFVKELEQLELRTRVAAYEAYYYKKQIE